MRSGVKKSPSAFGIVGSNIYGERERDTESAREKERVLKKQLGKVLYI